MIPLAVAILVCVPVGWAGDPCPSSDEMRSCSCQDIFVPFANSSAASRNTSVTALPPTIVPGQDGNGSLYTVVDCRVPKTLPALEEAILFALHRKAVDKLTVSDVPPLTERTLARLPSGWLKNTRVKQFEVRDTSLSGDFLWYGRPFEGQEQSLLWLTATRCQLQGALTYDQLGTIHTKGLKDLPLVEGMDLSYNRLTFISNSAFKHPSANLSTVSLAFNSIQGMEDGALKPIQFLKNVNLSHNLMQTISRNVFASPAKYLEVLDLSWNSLKALPTDFFQKMPALQVVNLSKNFLYALPRNPWSNIWTQLIFTDLSDNFIACDCNLLWLVEPSSKRETPKPGQTILGKCATNDIPETFTTLHDLAGLSSDDVIC